MGTLLFICLFEIDCTETQDDGHRLGGLPFIYPSSLAMKYLHHTKVIPEEDIPVGAHYRARTDMLDNVRGYHMVKEGLKRRIIDIERERRRAQGVGDRKTLVKGSGTDQISTSECQLAISLVDMNMRHLWILSTITKNHVVSDLAILDVPSLKPERPSEILNQGTKNLWEWLMYVKRWSRIQAKIEKPIHIATTSTKEEK